MSMELDGVFRANGFHRARRRYVRVDETTVLFEFRPKTWSPNVQSFIIEWSIVPQAAIAYFRTTRPHASVHFTWGIVAGRVEDDFDGPYHVPGAADALELPINDQFPQACDWLRNVLTSTYIPRLITYSSREKLLHGLRTREIVGAEYLIPRKPPADYLALYIDDGDPAELAHAIEELRLRDIDARWVDWLSQRLSNRHKMN